jgi:RNA 2',3'-cyclic 3'-phosphodiesterase
VSESTVPAAGAASGGKKHRLFFALVPDAGVRRQVRDIQQRLQLSGRAVSPPNLHVTLAFLGMQEAAVLSEVCAVASGLSFPPCRVTLDQLGQFGRGRVLWLGAGNLPAPLQEFQQSLVQALTAAGIGHDPKPWKFHLTLYRRLRKPPPTLGPVAIEWALSGFELIESVGSKNGVEYHSIARWKAPENGTE